LIKKWIENIDNNALAQVENVAKLPFIVGNVVVLPDCHFGYGMPIGCVAATDNVIIPNAVGVDIGCGMAAIKTSLTDVSIDDVKKIMSIIREKIPLGMNHHKTKKDDSLMPDNASELFIVSKEYENAKTQLGTLGGGNHFIEIQKGSDGHFWFMVHSGSRNLGFKVANHYNKIAINLNKRWCSSIPESFELAFLPLDTAEGDQYKKEMEYCMSFASNNRRCMMIEISEAFQTITKCTFDQIIEIPHNFAALEHHFGKNVVVHRKGATRASKNEIGIIPGSQGTKSYIVRGKGNIHSLQSCSHGAGRILSRKEARNTLNLQDEINLLDSQGILHSIRNTKDLDESPSAYKDISVVMKAQEDLIDIVVELTPVAVIKG